MKASELIREIIDDIIRDYTGSTEVEEILTSMIDRYKNCLLMEVKLDYETKIQEKN